MNMDSLENLKVARTASKWWSW